ncbi:hypothetical protein CHS0354_010221 [Potamilus streckersoni]|uniref:Uncharacterized protein n=1 Tax=Potamilus streckersoni TaxID=2493646 RepID=A0AAE0RT25_9BIVA|nr:hypothetical protein CHS0354_010221 [Potamilus streckersoni]
MPQYSAKDDITDFINRAIKEHPNDLIMCFDITSNVKNSGENVAAPLPKHVADFNNDNILSYSGIAVENISLYAGAGDALRVVKQQLNQRDPQDAATLRYVTNELPDTPTDVTNRSCLLVSSL